MRNHNNDVARDQDPGVFSIKAQDIIRNALLTRYTLLPYLYNLLYRSHTKGETVVRPLFFEYILSFQSFLSTKFSSLMISFIIRYMSDKNSHLVDRQFLFGPAVLITPVLQKVCISQTSIIYCIQKTYLFIIIRTRVL